MNEAKELADAMAELGKELDAYYCGLLLRRVMPSDAHILTAWTKNACIHLRAANQLLEELPKKSS